VQEIANLHPVRCAIRCREKAEIKQLLKMGVERATDNERIESLEMAKNMH
jgi:hypothetical protein